MRKTPDYGAASPSQAEFEREEGPPTSAAGCLFTATQRRLLGFLYGQPGREFHMQALFATTGTDNGAVQRELNRLQKAGLVSSETRRGKKFHWANEQSPIFEPLALLVQASFGLAEPLRESCAGLQACAELLFAYQTFDGWPGARPVFDMLLVLKPGRRLPAREEVLAAIDAAAQRLDAAVTLSRIATPQQLADPDPYLRRVLEQPRTWVFGDEGALAELSRAG